MHEFTIIITSHITISIQKMKNSFYILIFVFPSFFILSCSSATEDTSEDVNLAVNAFNQFLEAHNVPYAFNWNVKSFEPLVGNSKEYILTMKVYDLKILDQDFDKYAERVASLGSLLLSQSVSKKSPFTKFGISIKSSTGSTHSKQFTKEELSAVYSCISNANDFMQKVIKDSIDFSYFDSPSEMDKNITINIFEMSKTNLGEIEASMPSSFYFEQGKDFQLKAIMGIKRKNSNEITHAKFSMDTSTHKIIYVSNSYKDIH